MIYLDANWLTENPVTVTIRTYEPGHSRYGVIFVDEFPHGLILNQVNLRRIASAYGTDASEWRGKSITLRAIQIEVGDVSHRGIEVCQWRIELSRKVTEVFGLCMGKISDVEVGGAGSNDDECREFVVNEIEQLVEELKWPFLSNHYF